MDFNLDARCHSSHDKSKQVTYKHLWNKGTATRKIQKSGQNLDSKIFECWISFSIISKRQKKIILQPMLKCPG